MFVKLILMKIARFEKVSEKQFKNDLKSLLNCEEDLYDNIIIPKRATKGSAGYDFVSPVEFDLEPGETIKVPTGIRCKIDDGYVLEIFPRSSLGFKYQMALMNTVGIIDSDYYNADNEGHIMAKICTEFPFKLGTGDRFMQGIILNYSIIDDDDPLQDSRNGGFGSTGGTGE